VTRKHGAPGLVRFRQFPFFVPTARYLRPAAGHDAVHCLLVANCGSP
jgi:hypothetical protein